MSGLGNCADHKEMHKDIIITKTIVGRLDENITDLYKKNEEQVKAHTKNNDAVMKKLNKLEIHFITQDAARDRRTLDKIKKGAMFTLKSVMYIAAAIGAGSGAYAAVQTIILKIWR